MKSLRSPVGRGLRWHEFRTVIPALSSVVPAKAGYSAEVAFQPSQPKRLLRRSRLGYEGGKLFPMLEQAIRRLLAWTGRPCGLFLHALSLAIYASLACLPATARAANQEIGVVMHEGTRTAIVRPAGQSPHPVVIVLHGRGITADLTLRTSGFAEAAARHSFTAVFPQGSLLQWHDGRAGGPPGPDDVAFLRALTARLIEDRIALPGHIYIAGISNGGMMSFTMACQAGELFRGMGTVIANMPAGVEPCNLPPMPLVMVNGTADPLVPYRGGGVGVLGLQGKVLSAEKTAELFAHRNGCGASTAQPLAEKKSRRRSHRDRDRLERLQLGQVRDALPDRGRRPSNPRPAGVPALFARPEQYRLFRSRNDPVRLRSRGGERRVAGNADPVLLSRPGFEEICRVECGRRRHGFRRADIEKSRRSRPWPPGRAHLSRPRRRQPRRSSTRRRNQRRGRQAGCFAPPLPQREAARRRGF